MCDTIKKNTKYKDVPIILVTSIEKEEDKRRGIEVGAQGYIAKSSFGQPNLLKTIERLL